MSTEKFEILLRKLQDRTQAQQISWEKTSQEDQFQTVLGRYVIRLVQYYSGDSNEPDYFLKIIDEDGSIIDSISDVAIHESNPEFRAFAVMTDIYSLARRFAMGIDKALDSIIWELDDISQNQQ